MNAPRRLVAAWFLAMPPAELNHLLDQNATAVVSLMMYGLLDEWNQQWFYVEVGNPPDITNKV